MSSSDDLPPEVAEIDVTIPDVFTGVKDKATALEGDASRLDTIQTEVADIDSEDIEEVHQVADQVQSLRGDLIEADTVDDIESIYSELQQAIASPYIQQAKTSYREICELLGIEVDEETDEEIMSAYENSEGDNIEARANALKEVAAKVDSFGDATQDRLISDIDGNEIRYFKLPVGELQPLVTDYETREEALEAIATKAEQVDAWATPLETLPDQPSAYEDLDASIDSDPVTEYIDEIDFASVSDEIPVMGVVASHLRTSIDNGVTGLSDSLNSILQTSLADEHVDSIAELLTHPDVETDAREASLQDAYSTATTGDEHTTITDLNRALETLTESFETWGATMASHIQAAARIQQEISPGAHTSDSFEAPGEHISLDGDVEKTDVMTNPIEALEVVNAFEEWLSGLGSEGGTDGVSVDTLKSLIRGETISAQDVTGDIVEELTDMLGAGLQLTYQRTEDE